MAKHVVNNYMTMFAPMKFDGLRRNVEEFADWYLPTIVLNQDPEDHPFLHPNILDLGTNFKAAKLCQYAVTQAKVRRD